MVTEPMDWISAMQYCFEEEAQLVSFEDTHEMGRVTQVFRSVIVNNDGPDVKPAEKIIVHKNIMTSGMFFDENWQWYWTGSSEYQIKNALLKLKTLFFVDKTFSKNLDVVNQDDSAILNRHRDCLVLEVSDPIPDIEPASNYADANDHYPESNFRHTLMATKCLEKQVFMCEARVQTVTYYAWFRANWVDLLLGFLLIVMFVALCVSVCAYSSNDYGHRAARRRRGGARPRTTDADLPNVIDLPPSYEATVTIHRPIEPTETTPTRTISRMDQYKNRSKEFMNRFYTPKNTSNTNTNEKPRI